MRNLVIQPRSVKAAFGCAAIGLASLMGVGCTPDVSDRDLVSIDLPAVRRMLDTEKPGNVRVVDARSPEQYRAGHIPKATNLPITMLPDGARLPVDLENAKTVVVYGQNPGSGLARGVAKRIYLTGQKGVRLFEGGFDSWKQAGLPVEKVGGEADSAKP